MKKILQVALSILVIVVLAGCPTQNYPVIITIAAAAVEDSGFSNATSPGDSGILTLVESAQTFTMIYANDQASITFPSEANDSGTSNLTTKFWMAETEVTNAVMVEVLQWAYDNDKFSSDVGAHNGLDAITVKYGAQQLFDLDDINCRVDYDGLGSFSAESGYDNNPVTNVTWFGTVMFCNWLTEMRDGNIDNIVYTDIDTDWVDDEITETVLKTGYRLPSSDEWEYTARYRGSDLTNTVDYYNNPYFTKGNSASGAITSFNNDSSGSGEPGKTVNDEVAVYCYYWDSNNWITKYTSDEATVKSLGGGSANALGLYDMSGNVWEWCFTENGLSRIERGGSWDGYAFDLRVGSWEEDSPDVDNSSLGFRLCRTAE